MAVTPAVAGSQAADGRSRVASELRRLANLFASTELSVPELEQLALQISGLSDHVDQLDHPARGGWWQRGHDFTYEFDVDSPFRGVHSPWGPSMDLQRIGPGGAIGSGATGRLVADRSCAGPPNTLHGGILAGLFDEVFGEAAAHGAPDVFAVTGKLGIRYRKPTPLGQQLQVTATVVKLSSRSMELEAACETNGETTATATALMVVRGKRRQTA